MKRMLLLVDPQNDFIKGSLAVSGAAEKMNSLAQWLSHNPAIYDLLLVTRDSHPANHCSFTNSGGTWPAHCVAGTDGAQIWAALVDSLEKAQGKVLTLNKGENEEEYSIFQNMENRTLIKKLVIDEKIDKIDICGIAGDVCVLATLKDAERLFGKEQLRVLTQFSPSLDEGKALKDYISNNNIEYC